MNCIRPSYINDFQCDGKVCNSRCCKGWRVVVDDKTYQKYFSIKDEHAREVLAEFYYSEGNFELAQKYGKVIEKNEQNQKEENYEGIVDKIMGFFHKK